MRENDWMKQEAKIQEWHQNQGTASNIVPHPWRRFFSRGLDLALYRLIVTTGSLYLLRTDLSGSGLRQFLELLIANLLMVFLEPLLLSKTGTTPGKWLFGLVVRDLSGNRITYAGGLRRTFGIIRYGYGFSIPLYSLYTQSKCYEICTGEKELPWDRGFSYELKDTRRLRGWGYVLGMVLIIGLSVWIGYQAKMPINRGNITPEEYFENCNDFMVIHQIDHGYFLNAQGQWEEKPSDVSSVASLMGLELLNHTVVYQQGMIQKIIVGVETTERHMITSLEDQLFMALSSFVGADRGVSVFELYDRDITRYFKNGFKDFEFVMEGYTVKNTVEYSGYHDVGRLLMPDDNQEQYLHVSFVIERK